MSEKEKTHWKKNVDSNFISGEDMKFGLNDLNEELDVYLSHFEDGETFDQNQNQKQIKTVMHFKKVSDNKELHKGVLLNKTNALVFKSLLNSPFVDDWLEYPITIYAQSDKRHGWVVRFKPLKIRGEIKDVITALKSAKTLEELTATFKGLDVVWQNNMIILNKASELKIKLK